MWIYFQAERAEGYYNGLTTPSGDLPFVIREKIKGQHNFNSGIIPHVYASVCAQYQVILTMITASNWYYVKYYWLQQFKPKRNIFLWRTLVPVLFNKLQGFALWPSDAIWRHRSWSTLAWAMACCLTAPSHYLNQCWLIVGTNQWRLSKINFARDPEIPQPSIRKISFNLLR